MIARYRSLFWIFAIVVGTTSCGAKKPATISTLPDEPIRMAVSMPSLPSQSANCPLVDSPEEGKTTIIWLIPDTSSISPLQEAVIPAFEAQNPTIHVQVYPVDRASYFLTSRGLLSSGCKTPDLLNIYEPFAAYYAAYGWLVPLWNEYTFDEKEDWTQALRKSGRYNQELYSAPFSTTTSLLFYNATLLNKAGIALPGEDERWTWEKVVESAKRLTVDDNNDGTPDTWGLAWEDNSLNQLLPLVQSLGGKLIGEDGISVTNVIDSQAWLDAFAFYHSVFNTSKISPKSDTFDAVQAFRSGQLAFLLASNTTIDRLNSASVPWGVSRYPYFEKGKVVIPIGDWRIAVNSNSSNPEAAMEYLTWLTTKPGGEVLLKAGIFAPQKAVLNLSISEKWPGLPAYWKTITAEALSPTLPGPITPFYPVYEQRMLDAFQLVRNGSDPGTTLKETAVQLQADMK